MAIEHPGTILARQFERGELLRRFLDLLRTVPPDALANPLHFV